MPVAPVAGFTPFQQQAFGATQQQLGMAQPYIQAGAGYLGQSAAPITGQDVSQYYNPMASNVFGQMQNIFGQQQRNVTGQLTGAAGGVGADRIAVGQAELANQQGLAAGQTAAGLYQQALQAAQQQKQMQAGAGYGISQLGPAAQAAQLQSIGALGAAGGQQQQLAQALQNAQYQNQLAQIAWPYQGNQYLASITGGLAPAMGGATAGQSTTTYPTPSPLAQALGVGTSLLGLGMAPFSGGASLFGMAGNALGGLFGGGGGGGSYGPTYAGPTAGGYGMMGGVPFYSAAAADGGRVEEKADGGSIAPEYGKLGYLAERRQLGSMLPAAEAGNPFASEIINDVSGSLPQYDDGGSIQPDQPLPFPGSAIPQSGGMAPIPMLGATMPAGKGEAPIPYSPVRSVVNHPQINLRPMPLVQPTLQGMQKGEIQNAMSLASMFSRMGDSTGGVVNPFSSGEGFQEGGDTSFDDRFSAVGTPPPIEALGADPTRVLGNAMAAQVAAPTERPTAANLVDPSASMPDVYSAGYDVLNKQYGPNVAAAAMGNLGVESPNLNPSESHDQGTGLGIAGWRNERRDQLLNYAAENGLNPTDRRTQFAFLGHDLETNYPDLLQRMQSARSPTEAAAMFRNEYERPQGTTQGHPLGLDRATNLASNFAAGNFDVVGGENIPSGATPTSYQPTRFAQADTGTMSDAQNPYAMPQSQLPYPDAGKRDWGQNLVRSPWMSLVNAGAAMATTTGPIGSVIGQGIKAGVGELGEQRKALQTENDINLKAQSLYQQAQERLDEFKRMKPYQAGELALQRERMQQELWKPTGTVDISGNPLLFNAKTGETKPATSTINTPNVRVAGDVNVASPSNASAYDWAKNNPDNPRAAGLLGDAERYLKTGTLPTNMGRGQQGAQEASRIRSIAYQMAAERGIPAGELPKQWQQFKSEQTAITRYMSGTQGARVTSLNVVVDHAETLRALGEALKNGNIPIFNNIAQQWAQQTGHAAPVNFDMAKGIVGTELIKSLGVAGAGTEAERAELGSRITRASSPEQLNGIIESVVKPLLGGQLRGLRQGFKSSTGLPESKFNEMLFPKTLNYLEPHSPTTTENAAPAGFVGRTATGPSGKKMREVSPNNWEEVH